MMEAISSSETTVLTRATRRNIAADVILYSYCRENLKSYIALTGWARQRRRNVSSVSYELGFYTPEDGILHSHGRENLRSFLSFVLRKHICSQDLRTNATLILVTRIFTEWLPITHQDEAVGWAI
jgi:hypothetical protein